MCGMAGCQVMTRPLRIEFSDAFYQVMSRGKDHRAIVRDDADRQQRREWPPRTVEVYRRRLHGFCGGRRRRW